MGGLKVPAQWALRYAGNLSEVHDSRSPDFAPVRYQTIQASASLAF